MSLSSNILGLVGVSVLQNENKYLVLGFLEFTILATLTTVFFRGCYWFVFVYGMNETKLIAFALLHDFLKTILALFVELIFIAGLIFGLVLLLAR